MFCTNCGSSFENGLNFCTNCGAVVALNEVSSPQTQKQEDPQPQPTEPPHRPVESQPLKQGEAAEPRDPQPQPTQPAAQPQTQKQGQEAAEPRDPQPQPTQPAAQPQTQKQEDPQPQPTEPPHRPVESQPLKQGEAAEEAEPQGPSGAPPPPIEKVAPEQPKQQQVYYQPPIQGADKFRSDVKPVVQKTEPVPHRENDDHQQTSVSQQPVFVQPVYQTSVNTIPKRKRHVGLYVLLCILILLAGLIFYVLGSLFFFPPKDLGVRYTPADYASVVKKIGMQKDKAPTTGDIGDYKYVYSGSKNLDAMFTQEELTAWLNEGRPSYFALKNTQIRINKDNTVEVSGKVNFDTVKYIIAKNIPNVDWKKVPIPIPSKANVYVKSNDPGAIVSAAVSSADEGKTPYIPGGSIISANIGLIPVPISVLSNNNLSIIISTIKTIIEKDLPGVRIDKLEVLDGKIHFVGQIPEKMERRYSAADAPASAAGYA